MTTENVKTGYKVVTYDKKSINSHWKDIVEYLSLIHI